MWRLSSLYWAVSSVWGRVLQDDQDMVSQLVQSSCLDALLPVVVSSHNQFMDLASSLHGYQVCCYMHDSMLLLLCQNAALIAAGCGGGAD